MTTEIFKAGTQYNDFTGTSAAETQGFDEYLKSKALIKEDEFVIGIDFSPLVGISKAQNEIFLQIYLVQGFVYDEYEKKSTNESVLEVRKVETYIDMVQFFSLFKRLNVSFSWKGLLENKKIKIVS
ncbi:hypothetical protein RFH39_19070 [Acinetobacter baumannii]|uniref:hypothetical protein n=1 Tax=Acinetobacter baumannii TaxID=470 RepID=UPI00280E27B2|nr:hypothetical protein [Acinetobacter baumannii]MDQ8920382.1 hypothetical protein [Acinetobacter baumannii]MDQ8951331.1 hypothetical protein [Acinetobacter baumannii]MDQ8965448.1 hypothetical protein [Acinetobacter baumannii]MDQ8969191.1 hypothetical protein [Acinetobacter baumannii]MDQ8983197.1 hypothetical protein [Acinetobacter baumannii]